MRAIFSGLRAALFLALLPACAWADSLPVVGLDQNRQPQSATLSDQQFTQLFQEVIGKVSAPTLATLEAREKAGSANDTYWLLRDVCVGLGLNFSFGLGPIWSVSAAPRVRVGFSNSTHPKIPD